MRDWNRFTAELDDQIDKDCNYFKALWGIETLIGLIGGDKETIAIISKPYEGLKRTVDS